MAEFDPSKIRTPNAHLGSSLEADLIKKPSIKVPGTEYQRTRSQRAEIDLQKAAPESFRSHLGPTTANVSYTELQLPSLGIIHSNPPQEFSLFQLNNSNLRAEIAANGTATVKAEFNNLIASYENQNDTLSFAWGNKAGGIGIKDEHLVGGALSLGNMLAEGSYDLKNKSCGVRLTHSEIAYLSFARELEAMELKTALIHGPMQFCYGCSEDMQQYGFRLTDTIDGQDFQLGALFKRMDKTPDQVLLSCRGPLGQIYISGCSEGESNLSGQYQLKPFTRDRLSITAQLGYEEKDPQCGVALHYRSDQKSALQTSLDFAVEAGPKRQTAALKLNIRR